MLDEHAHTPCCEIVTLCPAISNVPARPKKLGFDGTE
jgi:hypothetical protein